MVKIAHTERCLKKEGREKRKNKHGDGDGTEKNECLLMVQVRKDGRRSPLRIAG
jgi:hypothetical protein